MTPLTPQQLDDLAGGVRGMKEEPSTMTNPEGVKERIAKIDSTFLGIEDHGIFTAYLYVNYGDGAAQGIGGYGLDDYDATMEHRVGTAYGHEWIRRVLLACGVDSWEKLPGRTVYILKTEKQDRIGASGALGIRPLPTEKGEQFIFAELDYLISEKEAVSQ